MKFGYPGVFVEDVAGTVEFYGKAFGIQAKFVQPAFAEMNTGWTSLAFGANANERREPGSLSYRENGKDKEPAGRRFCL